MIRGLDLPRLTPDFRWIVSWIWNWRSESCYALTLKWLGLSIMDLETLCETPSRAAYHLSEVVAKWFSKLCQNLGPLTYFTQPAREGLEFVSFVISSCLRLHLDFRKLRSKTYMRRHRNCFSVLFQLRIPAFEPRNLRLKDTMQDLGRCRRISFRNFRDQRRWYNTWTITWYLPFCD